MNRLVAGAVAGAIGTVALNVTTYVDMLVRGRPASKMPATVARRLAGELGIDLHTAAEEGNKGRRNREEALGALLGYVNGVALGIGYSLVRLVLPRPPRWLSTVLVGGAAMAASDYPATALGATDPSHWTRTEWLSDIVPHAIYGWVTSGSFDHMKK